MQSKGPLLGVGTHQRKVDRTRDLSGLSEEALTVSAMSDNGSFISAPSGLSLTLADGSRLPVVAFRVEGYDLIPYYMERDGSTGGVTFPATAAAAWISPEPTPGGQAPRDAGGMKFT